MNRKPTIEDLPDPIIEYILSYLSPYRDLKQCSLVNKTWYRFVSDVIRKIQRDFLNAVNQNAVEWCHLEPEPGPTITKRYSHSACINGNSMYIFGGCTTANTTFNDLWRLDLGTRRWIRPLATGTYPPPKAGATLVSYGDNLILLGGWTHTAPYPLHQVWRVFDHMHVYNTVKNRWTQITSSTACPPMAGHSATVHGDYMIVFGGIQRPESDDPFESSNDVWILDLRSYQWKKKEIESPAPRPRYGQSQVAIDNDHIMIIGGCGGPNMHNCVLQRINDIWLLSMNGGVDGVWKWTKMEILGEEKLAIPFLTFHPACKVGDRIVIMSRTNKAISSTSSLPRAPSQVWVPPRPELNRDPSEAFLESLLLCLCPPRDLRINPRNAKRPSSEVDPCVNGRRGVLKRPADRLNNPVSSSSDDEESQASSSTGKTTATDAPSDSQPSTSAGRAANSASFNDHAWEKGLSPSKAVMNVLYEAVAASSSIAAGSPHNDSRREGQGSPQAGASGSVSRRQRQLEGLDRMEARLQRLRAELGNHLLRFPFDKQSARSPGNAKPSSLIRPMWLYVMDFSNAIKGGSVLWKAVKNQNSSAPDDIILFSLVQGKGELIMFGGIQKEANVRNDPEVVTEIVSNSLHFMTAERFVI